MPDYRVLSIDTAYDRFLRLFANNRRRFYQSLDPEVFEIEQPPELLANRDNLLSLCTLLEDEDNPASNPYYQFLAVCSHGTEGVIKCRDAGLETVLFSQDDTEKEIRVIARSRRIYLFACRTANSDLPEMLVDYGALCVVGFSKSPRWGGAQGNQFWRDIDRRFLECFGREPIRAAFQTAKDELLARIDVELEGASMQYVLYPEGRP